VHVLGPIDRFPYAPPKGPAHGPAPAPAPKERLFALHKRLGIDRCVIVQTVNHGYDNRVVEDAIEAGGGRYLGIARVPLEVSDRELQRLADRGFRGVRFNFMRHLSGGETAQDVVALTARLADVGLHLQVHFQSELVHTVGQTLRASRVPVVIDHMGRVDARLGEAHPDFQALMGLLEQPGFHVKVSGIDRIDASCRVGQGYPAGVALAARLVERFPDQCLWGLDWPHPNHTHVPDDGELVNALARIAPSAGALEKLLVRNPQALYRFAT
jgi:2-pyrone-4,6-dicarboxylate lactonase